MNAKRSDSTAKPASKSPQPADQDGERIAKRLARAGLCSRRDAERWIAEGRVAVNGTVLASPACVVRRGDVVLVDGKLVPEPEPARLWRYHKPSGLVTTARDEKGRATVFDRLPPELPRVVSVGRLDLTTEGLLLLTNDGELARFLELPATGWTRRYRVRVFGEVDENQLKALEKGLTIDGVKYGPIEAALDRIQGRNAWLTVALKEGKNREIRKVMETLGLQVNRLIRVAYGPFQLGKLEEGAVEEVPSRVVKEQVSRFFTGREDEEVLPPSKTQQRARARAEGTTLATRPEPVAAPAAAQSSRRPPRTAAKRLENQAAWAKPEPAAASRRGPAKPAAEAVSGGRSATQRPAVQKPAAQKPAAGRGLDRTGDRAGDRVGGRPGDRAAAKPADAAPRRSRDGQEAGASTKPASKTGPAQAGSRKGTDPRLIGWDPKPGKSGTPRASAAKSGAAKSGAPKSGAPKPGTAKAGPAKPAAKPAGKPRGDSPAKPSGGAPRSDRPAGPRSGGGPRADRRR